MGLRRREFLGLLGALAVACEAELVRSADASEQPFMHGLTVATFEVDGFQAAEAERLVDTLTEVGADWVAVAPGWYQPDATASAVAPHPRRTPRDQDVAALIRKARAAGLRVLLKPFVDSLNGVWRAEFRPADPRGWMDTYADMVHHYAQIGADAGADMLSVGVELEFSQGWEAVWRGLIADVRQAYGGALTYAANHAEADSGVGYEGVAWWDALDFIGIDAYFPLAPPETETLSLDRLASAWLRHLAAIARWRAARHPGQPVIFTELGYESATGAAASPWGVDRSEPVRVDLELQAQLYAAFFGQPYRRDMLQGVFWWLWVPGLGGPLDSSHVPNGKPAADVLRNVFTATNRRPTHSGRA